jgi:hypothetical protein
MANIAYQYLPSLHDLFLYEDRTISWTGGSAVYKRPYAWNPSSWLYGYRQSLVGLSARLRTFSTVNGAGAEAPYLPFNNKSDPSNNPAFYNSWPPSVAMINGKFMLFCAHCYGLSSTARNPSLKFVGDTYPAGSYLAAVQQLRFINASNAATTIDPSRVIAPFSTDSSFPALDMSMGYDVLLGEVDAGYEISINGIKLADPRTMSRNDPVWVLDGSDKIIKCRFNRGWIDGRSSHSERFWMEAYLDSGSTSPQPCLPYTHDSGSKAFVEISAPTSWSAGDGVLGMIPWHLYSSDELQTGKTSTNVVANQSGAGKGYGVLSVPQAPVESELANGIGSQPGHLSSNLSQYMTSRGYSVTILPAASKASGGTASETIEADILGTLQESTSDLS